MEKIKIKKIIDKIIDNSIDDIRELRLYKSKEFIESEKKVYEIYGKIEQILKNQGMEELGTKLTDEICNINSYMEEFCYRQGIKDSLTKLDYLQEISKDIHLFI